MAWFYAAVFIVALVVSYSMQPKPETRPPLGINELNIPTAEIGREIPVLFGTDEVVSPNVCWYGDLRTVPVKKKGGKK